MTEIMETLAAVPVPYRLLKEFDWFTRISCNLMQEMYDPITWTKKEQELFLWLRKEHYKNPEALEEEVIDDDPNCRDGEMVVNILTDAEYRFVTGVHSNEDHIPVRIKDLIPF